MAIKHETDDERWRYNCEDCVRTREVGEVETDLIIKLGLGAVDTFQQKMFWPVLQCMQRGVRIDKKLRNEMAMTLQEEIDKREAFFQRVLGHPLNPRSSSQMIKLFYEDLKQKPNWRQRGKGMPSTLTCDDKALAKIANEEPFLRPLIKKLQEHRSLGVFLSTFVLAPLDIDGRMRTSYNIAGTETFRFSSSENAFGSGTNLQNIPKGGEDDEGFDLPNIRSIFIPDVGYEIFDTDLSKADLRIVTWESGEEEMKAMLREGKDPYVEVAREFHRDQTISKKRADGSENPKYTQFKSFAHGTHYLGTPQGLAQRLGLSVHQAQRTQAWYFGKFPKIKAWQEDFKKQVASRRFVENIFGYRRYYFDRPDDAMMREAIAWLPQCVPLDSEVLTKEGWKRIDATLESDAIAVWAPSGEIKFEVPERWNFGEAPRLIELSELGYSCTENHRIPYYNAGRESLCVAQAKKLPSGARIPRGGYYSGALKPSRAEIAYIAAFQADGHYDNQRDAIQFEFRKERKIERLTWALDTLGVPYTKSTVRRGATTFYIPSGKHGLLPQMKVYGAWLLQLDGESLDVWLDELEHWDGWRSEQGELWFSSSIKSNCEWVTTIAALRNKRGRWLSTDVRGERPNYRVTVAPNKGKRSGTTKRVIEGKVEVSCPTVSTGFFLIRRNGEISVTGNSTVALYINRIWMNLYERYPWIWVLLQVHDSLVGQYPIHRRDESLKAIAEASQIVLPYDDPLIIPVGVKTSKKSWGDCE